MHARVLGLGKGFREVSSVQECPYREGFYCIYSTLRNPEVCIIYTN